tara:strand:- start:250 stop:387 length:138 start_codon:yes stop_codon:yes gene_type:complete
MEWLVDKHQLILAQTWVAVVVPVLLVQMVVQAVVTQLVKVMAVLA